MWTEPRPVYVAAGLVMTAALLMLVVMNGVRQVQPVPTTPSVRQEAAASLEPVLKTEPARPQPESATAADKAEAAPGGIPQRPVRGEVRLAFGWQPQPLYGDWRYHPGLDIAAPAGSGVRAIWAGRVSDVFEDRHYGLTVVVIGGGYTVYYGSLAEARVDRDQTIRAGAIVGTVGEARSEPYPHLHLAVKSGDRYVDPQEILAQFE